ncbi:bifunctional DNA primase/polymerase, partial [Staphylococcus aureus]|nr:bifunctional DNA primase/polymerase [Staphylococcus aureus]
WPIDTIDTGDKAEAHWRSHPDDNMGVVLGPSHICSLDLDDLPASRDLFLEFGVDVDELAKYHPTIQGNPTRVRILFSVPEGMTLSRHSLSW